MSDNLSKVSKETMEKAKKYLTSTDAYPKKKAEFSRKLREATWTEFILSSHINDLIMWEEYHGQTEWLRNGEHPEDPEAFMVELDDEIRDVPVRILEEKRWEPETFTLLDYALQMPKLKGMMLYWEKLRVAKQILLGEPRL